MQKLALAGNVLFILYYIGVNQGILAYPDSLLTVLVAIAHSLIAILYVATIYHIDKLTTLRRAFDKHPGKPDGKL